MKLSGQARWNCIPTEDLQTPYITRNVIVIFFGGTRSGRIVLCWYPVDKFNNILIDFGGYMSPSRFKHSS